MKNSDLTKSALIALLLVSNAVLAEDQYPAADFQPKVLYQDEAAASGSSSAAPTKSTASTATDPQFPAANFEPKVLYSDSDYKHTAASPGSSSSSYSSSSSSASASSSDAGTTAPAASSEESSLGYMLGLLVLGAAGFILFKKGATITGSSRPKATYNVKNAGGLTGVAKYVMKVSGTGVSRYIEKNVKSTSSKASEAATGVAKYLASQSASAKPAAKSAATGVEKYMRKKG